VTVTTATSLPDAPRRAIRRTRRGDEKSEQIRSTATELFLKRGYDGVSVGEIAYLLHFRDATAFHRAFRRWTGEAPTQYRKRLF